MNAHLRVLDVTDPANMRLIGQYALRPEYSIHNMVLVGTKLYIAYYQEGVRVLDVSVQPRPREVAYFNTFQDTPPLRTGSKFFSSAIGIRVPGDGFIYVVDSNRGLLILQEELLTTQLHAWLTSSPTRVATSALTSPCSTP